MSKYVDYFGIVHYDTMEEALDDVRANVVFKFGGSK